MHLLSPTLMQQIRFGVNSTLTQVEPEYEESILSSEFRDIFVSKKVS